MNRARAFTIAETILATFILSIVMMTLFNIFPTSSMAVKKAEVRLRADNLAQSALEEYRSRGFDSLVLDTIDDLGTSEAGGVRYSTTITTSAGTNALLKRLVAEVSWEFQGKTEQVRHETWIADIEAK
ncbi:MAG: type II secretion system protein [Armatimonadetes bacterium]|nr:type II secretion system protein [Armatimonadota bacterium]